jgi:hypothetical protein
MVITEAQFAQIVVTLKADRDSIVKHNPIGSDEEVMLWMLLNSLVLYLSLSEMETPCFTGRPDEHTYRQAISHILAERRAEPFDIDAYLDNLLER